MKIKELLSDESKWTQGAYARDAQGRATTTFALSATSFCLVGAARACYCPRDYKLVPKFSFIYLNVMERLAEHIGQITGFECMEFGAISCFNDNPNTTFEQVKSIVELLDI